MSACVQLYYEGYLTVVFNDPRFGKAILTRQYYDNPFDNTYKDSCASNHGKLSDSPVSDIMYTVMCQSLNYSVSCGVSYVSESV